MRRTACHIGRRPIAMYRLPSRQYQRLDAALERSEQAAVVASCNDHDIKNVDVQHRATRTGATRSMQLRPRVIEGRATTPAHVPAANAHSQRPLRPCKRVSGTDLTTLGYRNFQITRPVFLCVA